jgi:uncharacterized protein
LPSLTTLIDAIFAALFLVAVPIFGLISHRNLQSAIADGFFQSRRETYFRLMAVQSITATSLISYWLWAERSVSDLGITLPTGWPAVFNVLFFVGAFVALAWMRSRLRRKEELRTEAWTQLVRFMDLLPHNKRELKISYVLAVIVGISEELAYRGFLIWWLQTWVPFWAAVLIVSAAFGFAHLYQGRAGILKTTGAGLIFGAIYWASGHILLAMALHALLDAHAFRVALLLQNHFEWLDVPPPSPRASTQAPPPSATPDQCDFDD